MATDGGKGAAADSDGASPATSRPTDSLGTVLRQPIVWLTVGLAGLLAMVMTFSYLGGFLDPVGHLRGLEVGIVNEDQPVTVAGVKVDAGTQIVANLDADSHVEVRWVTYPSAAAARRAMLDNELVGAIVIPSGFSTAIGQVGLTGGTGPAASLDVLRNDGAGLFQTQFLAEVTNTLGDQVNHQVNAQLVSVLTAAGLKISPAGAATIGRPVSLDSTAVVSVAGKTGRGLAPFYAAVMATLTGFLSASLCSIAVDLLRGTEHLELLGHDLGLQRGNERPVVTWAAKAILSLCCSLVGGAMIAITAVGILGMRGSGWKVALVAALGAGAISMATLVFLTLFGIGGELLGVLFTTIFGVPSALGVYPAQALPGFFRFVSSWHPMHYLTDAMRSVAFFDARSAAGLGRAVVVLVAWLVGSIVVGLLSAVVIGRRDGVRFGSRLRTPTPARPPAAP